MKKVGVVTHSEFEHYLNLENLVLMHDLLVHTVSDSLYTMSIFETVMCLVLGTCRIPGLFHNGSVMMLLQRKT